MKAETVFQKGQIVEIFQFWFTKQESEGKAKLFKFIRSDESSEYWTVKFESDGAIVDRFIKID